MRARNLPARIAAAEERAGIKRGLGGLTDDELDEAIAAVRRLAQAEMVGTDPDPADIGIGERVAALYHGCAPPA